MSMIESNPIPGGIVIFLLEVIVGERRGDPSLESAFTGVASTDELTEDPPLVDATAPCFFFVPPSCFGRFIFMRG